MSSKEIKMLLETNEIYNKKISQQQIDLCIKEISKHFGVSLSLIPKIIIDDLKTQTTEISPKNKNSKIILNDDYTDQYYDLDVDEYKIKSITSSEQEYENRDFRKVMWKRIPKFDQYSFIPYIFQNKYWIANKEIESNFKENINYTNKTLSYSRINEIGKHIINCIT